MIFKNQGIKVKATYSDGITPTIIALNSDEKESAIFGKMTISQEFIKKHKEFFLGQQFGEVTIPSEHLGEFTANLNQIELARIDHPKQIIINSKPNLVFRARLMLSTSGIILNEVSIQCFISQSQAQFHFLHKYFKMIISSKIRKKELSANARFQIDFKTAGNVIDNLSIYEFFHNWIEGEILKIHNIENNRIADFMKISFNQNHNFIKHIHFLFEFFRNLKQIENASRIYFRIPEKITLDDFKNADFLSNYLRGGGIHYPRLQCTLRIKLTALNLELFKKDCFAIRFSPDDTSSIKILNEDVCYSAEYYAISDAFLANPDIIDPLLVNTEVDIKILSKSESLKVELPKAWVNK